MNIDTSHDLKEKDLLEFLEKEYENADNKEELDYWQPYSQVIIENLELRNSFELSQQALAEKLNTKQSVISRFENMGRLPSYDFLARLSNAYSHKLGITLHGDFMAIVPIEQQEMISRLANEKKQPTRKFVQSLLDELVLKKEKDYQLVLANATKSNVIDIDFIKSKKNKKEILSSNEDFVSLPDSDQLKYFLQA